MTTPQLILMVTAYAVAFVAVSFVSRAGAVRTLGALVGGLASAVVFLGTGSLGSKLGLWRIWVPSTTGDAVLLLVATAISLAPTYPLTWRVTRRFGWWGLGLCVLAAALIGPPRDYLVATQYPMWVTFSFGVAPVLSVAVIYATAIAAGHSAMRLVSGPAGYDRLARHTLQAPSN